MARVRAFADVSAAKLLQSFQSPSGPATGGQLRNFRSELWHRADVPPSCWRAWSLCVCGLAVGVTRPRKRRLRQVQAAGQGGGRIDNVPLLILHDLQRPGLGETRNHRYLRRRLRELLAWAAPLVPSRLRILELRLPGAESAVPGLLPEAAQAGELVELVDVKAGLSTLLDASAPRALVCGGVLELALYPCHDLIRGGVEEVGLAPHLCGSSGRSGELLRARTTSHLENVLGVKILGSLQAATRWLLPEGPAALPPARNAVHELQIDVVSEDNTELNEDQMLVVRLLFPQDVSKVKLRKIGKGWTSAMKFFCEPTVIEADAEVTGAPTFLKMGKVEKLEHELNITQYMMEVLGGFCPQLLAYAEHGGLAALHLSLADLGDRTPRGLAEIYEELLEQAGGPKAEALLGRISSAIDFVFDELLWRLHSATSPEIPCFSMADELGLCKDLPDGMTGAEKDLNMNSAWVLEKLWRKEPGDGGLASSVRIHIRQILGEEAAKSDTLSFLDGHALELPNVCTAMLESRETLVELRKASHYHHRTCFVHGDLHGDNIMVDTRDNRFLIDFGKTGIGFSLEDVTWLESFVILSYTELQSDEELAEALDLVPLLAPRGGLTLESCEEFGSLQGEPRPSSPRLAAMRAVLGRLRHQLGRGVRRLARLSRDGPEAALQQAGLAATLVLLRNSLFFMAARENQAQPRRRRLALALACAYARSALAALRAGPA